MNQFFDQLALFFRRLSMGQRLAIGGVLGGSVAALVGVAMWVSQPDYAFLVGRLDPSDANQIVEILKGDKIPYELEDNGAAVFVPREHVSDLRIRLAGEGLITDGIIGDELFDNGTMGMTDKAWSHNLKRALQGELTRTITNLKQVESARVHLVLTERSAFRRSQTPASAAVQLTLARGQRLSDEQIAGITALVAGAVEGLSPAEVTITDTQGNRLSNPNQGNTDALLTSNQLDTQRAIEQHLVGQGQTMLDQVLGGGNAIVRVAATLDFTKSVAERKTIDPESATVISEERLEEESEADQANSQVRNYELSETRERSEKNEVEIEFLTVSVILNQKLDPPPPDAPEAVATPRPYTPAELSEIEALVKNAVGFSPDRNDRFAIHQARFDTSADDEVLQEMRLMEQQEQIQTYIRYGLMALALLVALWLMRSAGRRATSLTHPEALAEANASAKLGAGGQGILGEGLLADDHLLGPAEEEMYLRVDDVYASKLSPEARARMKAKHAMFEEITQQVLANPEEAAGVLRSWIVESMAMEEA